jgi:uncharacterized protein
MTGTAGAAAGTRTWHQIVRAKAQDAALADAQAHWGSNDIAFNYRWEHVQAVVRLAIRLAELTGADREIVEAAAWLHDVARPHSHDHARDGALAASRILADTDFPHSKIAAVVEAVEKHVGLYTAEPVEPLEAAVLWDADKLSKLGATAVMHFIGYQVMVGEGTTVQLLEKLPNPSWMERTVRSFHTPPARQAGWRRLATYRALWVQAQREFDGRDLLASPGGVAGECS